MNLNTRRQRYGANEWNRAAALNLVDTSPKSLTIQDGKITKAVVAKARDSQASNIHSLDVNQSEDSDIHHTYRDYYHSMKLPFQALQNGSRRKLYAGTRLGSSVTSATDASTASYHTNSYASRAAAPPSKEAVQAPYAMTHVISPKHNNEAKHRDPFQALAQTVKNSSGLPPHLRAPSVTSLQDVQGSRVSSSLSQKSRAPSSVAPTYATQVCSPKCQNLSRPQSLGKGSCSQLLSVGVVLNDQC